jgi:hypothetical protein
MRKIISTSLKICLFTFFILVGGMSSAYAATYYSKATGLNANLTTSWTTARDGSGTSPSNFTTAGDVFTIQNGHTLPMSASWSVTGNLSIENGGTLTVSQAITIGGTTTISGTLNITTTTGTRQFTGLLTVNSGGTWNNGNVAEPINFRGGVTNNGTFTAGTGVYTFSTNSQTINGTLSIPNVTVTGVTLTNNGTLSVSTALSGTGGLTQSSGSVLNIGGTSGITTLTATASGNTVNYNGAAQTLKATTYDNLTLSGTGAKTFPSGTTTVNNVLSIENGTSTNTFSGTLSYGSAATLQYNAGSSSRTVSNEWPATFSGTGGVIIKGTGTITLLSAAKTLGASVPLNINSGATLATNNNALTFGGNFINNGTFTAGTSTVTFNGTSAQTISGTSATTFYNLTINNTGTSGNNTVTLQKATTVTNTLTLVSGIVNTTSTNLLSVTNTATNAISGGSSISFVNGPLKWSLPAGLASGSSYVFPVGVGTNYYPFTLVNPTTGTTAPTVQIEAKATGSGGTFDGTLFSLSSTEYWTMTTTGSFTNSSVSVSRPTAISPYNVIAGSTAANGTYTSLGGTAGTNGVTNSNSIGSNRYFALGRKTGEVLWLKADAGTSTTTEGSGVTTWNDQSGTANHATSKLTAPTYQSLGWNFNPIINFSAGYYLSSTDPITDDMTFFAVYSSKQSSSSGSWWLNPAIIGDEANGTQNDYGLCTTGGKLFFKGTAGDNFGAQTTDVYNDGFPKIVSVTRQKSATGYIYLYVNGTQAASTSSDNTSLSDPQKIGIGNHYGYQAAAQYVGGISEIAGATTVYSTSDRQNFESYLAIKYGITLSHDYTNSSGTTVYAISGYNYDIAGLGRDDSYNLHQKVSSTSNYASGSSKVIMASNNDFTSSNLALSRTALTNGQFLIWGHNNGAVKQWVNISGTSDYIVNRIWKLQNTNTISNVNFQIDLTGFPSSPSGYYCLKVATNASFTTGVTNYVLTNTSANLYYCGGVNFPTGTSFFSISYVKNYWMGSSSIDWGTTSNWTANLIPTNGADVEYATVANYGTAAVNDLQLDADRTIGSLINATGKRLIIPAGKALTVNNTITISDSQNADLIHIHSGGSSTSEGTLIFHNDAAHPVYGTVEMYSKAYINATGETNNKFFWQYFGIPFRSLKTNPSFNGAYVRKWDETGTDITNHWLQLGNSDVLQSFLGYEICQPSTTTYSWQGILENRDFSSGELAYTSGALYPGQHIFGNSYTAAIDITQINFGNNMEKTVYLYNTGSYNNWDINHGGTSYSSGNTSPGTYAAIPKNQAGQGGIQGQIPSMQGFLVKAMSSSAEDTIFIPYSSVAVKNTTLQRAKATEGTTSTEKQYLRIDLKTDTVTVDRMWIFNEENCTRSFDNGWDGPKMLPASGTPALCAMEKDGIYQVNSVNDLDETKLGFRKGTETEYSLAFYPNNLQQRYPAIYLLDETTNKAVKIENEGTVYTFTATGTEDLQQRFRIVTRYYEKGEPEEASQIKIFSSKNHIVIDNLNTENGEALIYDISGRKIAQEKFPGKNVTVFGDYLTGAYVVRAASNGKIVTKRIIMK